MATARQRKRHIAALALIVILVTGMTIWYRRNFAISPWTLRYEIADHILSVEDSFIRWCKVPRGEKESLVRARLSVPPVLATRAGDARLKRYVHVMTKAGFTRPPDRPGTRVLVYEGGTRDRPIVVYYYFGSNRLQETFISRY